MMDMIENCQKMHLIKKVSQNQDTKMPIFLRLFCQIKLYHFLIRIKAGRSVHIESSQNTCTYRYVGLRLLGTTFLTFLIRLAFVMLHVQYLAREKQCYISVVIFNFSFYIIKTYINTQL